jgi:hypothetical protein
MSVETRISRLIKKAGVKKSHWIFPLRGKLNWLNGGKLNYLPQQLRGKQPASSTIKGKAILATSTIEGGKLAASTFKEKT